MNNVMLERRVKNKISNIFDIRVLSWGFLLGCLVFAFHVFTIYCSKSISMHLNRAALLVCIATGIQQVQVDM